MAVVIGSGSLLLSLSLSMNVIALLVPYWALFRSGSHRGLWGECTCNWFFDGNETFPDWFRAVQGLYAVAVGLIVLSVIIVFVIYSCTEKKGGSAMLVAGILLAIAATCIVVSVILFGAYGADGWKLKLDDKPQFGWAMWIGVAGAIFCLLASIMHIHQGRPQY